MNHYVGIDVSSKASSVRVVDGSGKIVRESKIVSESNVLRTKYDLRRWSIAVPKPRP
jgi:hypothetical protein